MNRLALHKETLRSLNTSESIGVNGGTVFPPPTEGTSCCDATGNYCHVSGSGGGGMTSRTRPCPL